MISLKSVPSGGPASVWLLQDVLPALCGISCQEAIHLLLPQCASLPHLSLVAASH